MVSGSLDPVSPVLDAALPIYEFDFRLAQHAGSPPLEVETLGIIGGELESNVFIGAKDLETGAHRRHHTANFEGMIQANWAGDDIRPGGNNPIVCLKI